MPLDINYWNLCGHQPMLEDRVRCRAFRRALAEIVTSDSVVLDIGAGTGILSMFAAQAGAKRVYAVERTIVAGLARELIEANGYADRIEVIQSDVQDVTLPEKVDVIVSEWLGGYAVDENLLPVVIQARDRWLKPGGKMIPGDVSSILAPVWDMQAQQDLDFWRSYPYDLDFAPAEQAACRDYRCGCEHVRPEHLLCAGQEMWALDSLTFPYAESLSPFTTHLEFVAAKDGRMNALAAWFRAELSPQVMLDVGPHEPDTHWGRTVFPIDRTLEVTKGTKIVVDFTLVPLDIGVSNAIWDVAVGDYRFRSEASTSIVG
jgi:SAM-dependent methyltransferase